MNHDYTPYGLDCAKNTGIFLHPTATPLDVMQGVSADAVEITQFVSACSQTPQQVSCTLAWHDELYGANQPKSGQVLEIKLEDTTFWIGIVQSIDNYTLSSGTKTMSLVARSRDAMPAWREMRRITDVYPVGTELDFIARHVLYGLGLQEVEINLPALGMNVVQSNMQLADLPPWQMLTTLLQPAGYEPYVDTMGRVKGIQRDTTRAADIYLTDNTRLMSVNGSKSKPSITELRVKWLDPNLSLVDQVDRSLANATITAGFFQLKQTKDIYFSADQSQRARNTRLVVKQSANSGILPACTEKYEQLSPTSGKIILKTAYWVPGLITNSLAGMIAASYIPDGVISLFGGITVPKGRLVHAAAEAGIMITMMSIGTGMYEIWGTPYDSVHVQNSTTAYNSNAKPWETNVQELENDLVMNEEQAQAMAIRELIYAYRSTSSWGATIVDDPRIEKGDIIQLRDGSRLYVTDYKRDLTFGSAAKIDITGFRC